MYLKSTPLSTVARIFAPRLPSTDQDYVSEIRP